MVTQHWLLSNATQSSLVPFPAGWNTKEAAGRQCGFVIEEEETWNKSSIYGCATLSFLKGNSKIFVSVQASGSHFSATSKYSQVYCLKTWNGIKNISWVFFFPSLCGFFHIYKKMVTMSKIDACTVSPVVLITCVLVTCRKSDQDNSSHRLILCVRVCVYSSSITVMFTEQWRLCPTR